MTETAKEVAQRGVTREGETWGPREIVAHLAGWEVMATVLVPRTAAGMVPFEETDNARQDVMDDAINATIVTMIGDQSLDMVCDILRRAYKSDIAMLWKLDEKFFQPGEYVYERTKGVIEHCQKHAQALASL